LDEFCEINIEEEEYIIVDETGNLSLINLTKEKIKLKLLKENKFETYEFTMNKNNQYDEKSFHRNSRFFKYENYNDLEFFLVGKEIHTNTSKIDLLSGSNLDYIQSNDSYKFRC